MKKALFIINFIGFAISGRAALSVPLTIQEAIYPGSVPGVARTAEPFCMGVPVADSAGISGTGALALTGASAAQFRILGNWPSGHAKWIQVCGIVPSLSAGGTTTVTLTDGGSGNFGGSNLAIDNGSTITVSTGSATFTIKKAHFNVLDQVAIAGTTVVASGSSQGMVITGPNPTAAYPANVTCGTASGQSPCTTAFSSANDPNSTATIEENGPAMAVIKATGDHVDGSGHVYLHFTVRMYFYQGKSSVKLTSILRNADYGTSNTYATAYKGHQGYEVRITPNISGTLRYTIANDTASPTTGTLGGSDSVYLYQGESQLMKFSNWCGGSGCVPFSNDQGYSIVKNGANVVAGSSAQYPQGWADISNASGAGVEIGQYQLAAYGEKSLEFNGGGTDVRAGIWARENSQPYYQSWPAWSIHDVYLIFHSSALTSPANEFLKMQHWLVGRASASYYNSVGVFPYPLIDPTQEDSFYNSVFSAANSNPLNPQIPSGSACPDCDRDWGATGVFHSWDLNIWRFYAWENGGGGNQMEFRWAFLLDYLRRGMTGRYLYAANFYRMISETSFPHSDGFNWRDRPGWSQPGEEVNSVGYPEATSTNSSLGFVNWTNIDHQHWYGMTDYYFLTGDETVHDAILDGPMDRYLNTHTVLNVGKIWDTRSVGGYLLSTARLSQFLAATGDSTDAAAMLAQGNQAWSLQVKPDLCVSGYPAGCTTTSNPSGTSRVRGANYAWAEGINQVGCPPPGTGRDAGVFQTSILLQGLWEYRTVAGPGWTDYNSSLDVMYGMSQWALSEGYHDDGSGAWRDANGANGSRYYVALDIPNACDTEYYPVRANQTVWFPYYIQHVYLGSVNSWQQKFYQVIQRDMYDQGTDEFGHFSIGAVIDQINNPGSSSLVNVPVTGKNNGGGSYTLSWTVPANAQSYRIKSGSKNIVDWIGFDPAVNQFTGDPVNNMNWFAATDVTSPPAPGAAGSIQQFTVSGLGAAQFFAVKAWVGGGGAAQGPNPPTISITSPVSGGTVTGSVSAAATVSAGAGVSSVQFTLDSAALGTAIAGVGPYTVTWDSTMASNGAHTLAAVVTDNAGHTGNASISVTVNNTATLALSGITAGALASSSATISWTTTTASDSQVVYGTTASYGSSSPLSETLMTTHSITLTGLAASTTYHYQVLSRDGSGNLARSGDFSFTTLAASSGTSALPVGAWTMVKTHGFPAQSVGWEKLVYSTAAKKAVMLGNYHEAGSEPNRGMVAYDFTSNRWDVLDVGGYSHNENMPEGGHPAGMFTYNPNQNVFVYYCCGSGSMQVENVFHTWWFDPVGRTGRDKHVSPKPGQLLESSAAYDAADDKMVFGPDWIYTPSTDSWKQSNPTTVVQGGGTFPSWFNGLAMYSMVYDNANHLVYLFGGRSGYGAVPASSYYSDIYSYNYATNTWTLLKPSGTPPPPREMAALAYDSTNNVIMMFGGAYDNSGGSNPTIYNDTYIYDPTANSWTKLSSPQSPPTANAAFEKLAYDPDDNVFILAVSGDNGYADGSWNDSYSMQTWLFRYQGGGGAPGGSQPVYQPTAGSLNRQATGWANEPFLASNGTSIYTAWVETGAAFDASNTTWPHINASSNSGTSWSAMGSTQISSANHEAFVPTGTYSAGSPWVSYTEEASVVAMRWNGSAWQGGAVGFIGGGTDHAYSRQARSQITDVAGSPYIALTEVDRTVFPSAEFVYVMYWNGSSWVQRGTGPLNRGIGAVTTSSISITSDGSNPYVAWTEYTNATYANDSIPQVYVSRWNGSAWVAVGGSLNVSASTGWASDAFITYLNGQPYVAWTERTQAGNSQVYVKTYNGSNWVLVGGGSQNRDTNTGWAFHPSLAVDPTSGSLYLGWAEQTSIGQPAQAYVSKFSTGAWTPLGSSLNADPALGSTQRVSVAVAGGQPVAAWGEAKLGSMRQVFVKQWNGSSWGAASGGSTGGSTSTPPPVACDLNGDGKVNALDVQAAINQVLGTSPCGTADLRGSGQCNVIDVQRIINASLGGACVTGQ